MPPPPSWQGCTHGCGWCPGLPPPPCWGEGEYSWRGGTHGAWDLFFLQGGGGMVSAAGSWGLLLPHAGGSALADGASCCGSDPEGWCPAVFLGATAQVDVGRCGSAVPAGGTPLASPPTEGEPNMQPHFRSIKAVCLALAPGRSMLSVALCAGPGPVAALC